MSRINGLVRLVSSNEALKPTGIFKSEGTRADILRSIVVFLHATFEDILRSHIRGSDKHLSFYSGTDIDKALKLSGIDAKPFKSLYPPLVQMAKRRKRIVHEADLSKQTDTVSASWEINDDWELIMWLLAVPAFYYQMRVATKAATVVESAMVERFRKAMRGHVDWGKQLVALPGVSQQQQREAVEKMLITLKENVAMLRLNVSDFNVKQD